MAGRGPGKGAITWPALTDRPCTEAKEVLGGYYILRPGSDDEAVRPAADCPHLACGSIEIRRIEAMPPE